MIDQADYNNRLNLILNRDKSSYLKSLLGWKCVLDSCGYNFDAKMLKVKFHLIYGERNDEKNDLSYKAFALKGVFELFEAHYFYIVPEGFQILFEGNGQFLIISNIDQLSRAVEKYRDMHLYPYKYIR